MGGRDIGSAPLRAQKINFLLADRGARLLLCALPGSAEQ